MDAQAPEGQGMATKLLVGAADIDVDPRLAERDGNVVAELVAIDVAPLALHDVGQALCAEPQQDVALGQRRRLHLKALRGICMTAHDTGGAGHWEQGMHVETNAGRHAHRVMSQQRAIAMHVHMVCSCIREAPQDLQLAP